MLTGVVVLDFSLQLPGPYATMLLYTFGARVIRVEPPQGDPARLFDPVMVETLEAGKEHITLDLRVEAARQIVYRLAERSDVVVEGFRPGVADRLGIGYDALRARRSDTIYCSISGFGQTGPYRSIPGHDINYLGVGGGLSAAEHQSLDAIGIPVIDLATGTAAAFLIAAALRERELTGRGRYLDVAMLDSAIFWSAIKTHHGSAGDTRSGDRGEEPTYGVFRAQDGKRLTMAVLEDKFWARLCVALEWTDWHRSGELAEYAQRRTRGSEIASRLHRTIASHPRDYWLRRLWEADIPVAPVNSLDEVPTDPQVIERHLFRETRDGHHRLRVPLACDPVGISPTPAPVRTSADMRSALLNELGYDKAAQVELETLGVFG